MVAKGEAGIMGMESFDYNKTLVSIKRVDELHSPTGKHKGFILEFDGNIEEKLENYHYFGIRISNCEMWCSEQSLLGQWLTKNLAILYVNLSSDVYNNEVEDNL